MENQFNMLTTDIQHHLKTTIQTANQSCCMHLHPILLGQHFLKWNPHALGKWMEVTKTPLYYCICHPSKQ
jgi:hypothetical protein